MDFRILTHLASPMDPELASFAGRPPEAHIFVRVQERIEMDPTGGNSPLPVIHWRTVHSARLPTCVGLSLSGQKLGGQRFETLEECLDIIETA